MISESPSGAAPIDEPESSSGEERLVREAILLVASHGAPRVLVAGMAHGERVIDRLARPALEAGVRLRARATADDSRVDVLVEAIR